MRLFQTDPDIRIANTEIYLDPAEPRKVGIISHGHSDHIGRHEHFGTYEVWGRQSSLFGHRFTTDLRGKAILIPPHMTRDVRRVARAETIALTGWALHGTRDADHGLPLSDHADFNELVAFAEQCRAGVIYVTHGSARFVEELRRRGIRAEFLRAKPQMRLF